MSNNEMQNAARNKPIFNWLFKDILRAETNISGESFVDGGLQQRLNAFARLFLRAFLFFSLISLLAMLFVAFDFKNAAALLFSDPKWNIDEWLHSDLKLDGSTFAGLFSTAIGSAVALAGAFAAILLALQALSQSEKTHKLQENQHKLQENQATLENPYYQQALHLVEAARRTAAIFELLMAGMERTRLNSYNSSSQNIQDLALACKQNQEALYEALILTGLFSYLLAQEQKAGRPNLLPSIVQMLFKTVNELATIASKGDTSKGTSTALSEHQSTLEKYIISMAGLIVLTDRLEKIPSAHVFARLLEKGSEFTGDPTDQFQPVIVSRRLRNELALAARDYAEQVTEKIGLKIMSTEKARKKLIDKLCIDFLFRFFSKDEEEKIDFSEIDKRLLERAKKKCENLYQQRFPTSGDSKETLNGVNRKALTRIKLLDIDISFSRDCLENAFIDLQNMIDNNRAVRHIYSFADMKRWCGERNDRFSPENTIDYISRNVGNLGNDDPKEFEEFKKEMHDSIKNVANWTTNIDSCLHVIWLDRDKDFYEKLYLSRFLPWCVVVWGGYPYLPNPGVGSKKFLDIGTLEPFSGGKNCATAGFRSSVSVIVTGALTLDSGVDPAEHINAVNTKGWPMSCAVSDILL